MNKFQNSVEMEQDMETKCPPPWEIFENLKELVYVVDVENYSLVYMNKEGLRGFRYKNVSEIFGKECYKLLQNSPDICKFCPNEKLEINKFYEWEYYNPVLKDEFFLKDTLVKYGNKLYKIEIAINVSKKEDRGFYSSINLNEELILNEFLKRVHTSIDVEDALNEALKFLVNIFGGDRAYIFEESKDGNTINNTYEYCSNGIDSLKPVRQRYLKSDIISWYKEFIAGETMMIKDREDVKNEYPQLYYLLKLHKIDVIVLSPLMYDSKIIGFFGIDNPPQNRVEHIGKIFKILSHFIVSIIKRRNLIKSLKKLSYHDQLTGAKNRNALNSFLEEKKNLDSAGVVFCDIDGLKKVNDIYGHIEGDNLIKEAYNLIHSVFEENMIYRIGGDEFLVIFENVDCQKFDACVKRLRANIEKSKTCKLSVGDIWSDDAKLVKNIEKMINTSDMLMYKEKYRRKI